jgi:uncharacterized protein (DUF1501 family)
VVLLAGARLDRIALAAPAAGQDALVVVSLRGGWDALSAVVPRQGDDQSHYLKARPTLGLRDSLDLDGRFGLNPALASLMPLWQAGRLAVIQAAGLQADIRSHFEAIASIEAGAAVRRSGWLGRYLATLGQTAGYPGIAIGAPSMALQGFPRTLTLQSVADLDFKLPREDLLARLYGGASSLDVSGREALKALQTARALAKHDYKPKKPYPDSEFCDRLREAARMIKCPELGVRALTVELDGWDTHTYQTDVLPLLLADLADGLLAFSEDLEGYPVTVVVISEFGRRLAENASGGTDHGHGSAMLVMGTSVQGGLYGRWPGLATEQLYDLEDLAVTTDYRDVLSEILSQRLGCCRLDKVFPDHGVAPTLGLFGPSG